MAQSAGTNSEKPVVIPVQAYISEAYAREEEEKLWPMVWQVACREEEIPDIGDYVTYDIMNESIIVVRTAVDRIRAFYNVCQHRGRRLTEGCGHTNQFYCRFHGWSWKLTGENAFVLDPQDWEGALNQDDLGLKPVKVDTWSGWVFINMDPDSEPLADYLRPATPMLDMYELGKMRYRWRKWLYFPCNWKTALEAFAESYHVDATHPQIIRYGANTWWSKAEGKHGWHGVKGSRDGAAQAGGGMNSIRAAEGSDARAVVYEQLKEYMDTVNATTTDTFVEAARRLVDELPPDAQADEVARHLMESARKIDLDRGVVWPELDPQKVMDAGHDWHIFPNMIVLPGVTFALCYRARPNGYDPNSCIFDVFVIERFPEGQEPKTEWVFAPEPTEDDWLLVLSQDFRNMPEVQRGMHSRGFAGSRPSPVQEAAIINFHRTLAQYMGTGNPEPIGKAAGHAAR
jgi:phenylpropionate dioxygenase-like ring-hydroxylating dioxygenase large terminal subunit